MGRKAKLPVNGKLECSKCKEAKPLVKFNRHPATKSGYDSRCKTCRYTKIGRRKQNVVDGKLQCNRCKEWKLLEQFSPHKLTSTGKDSRCKPCRVEATMLRQSKTKEAYLSRAWRSLKDGKRGKRMSMEKTIDHHYLADLWEEQGGICPLTGLTLTHKAHDGGLDTNASIDRLDPQKGYVRGNVRLVCRQANYMRRELDDKKLVEWCHLIVRKHGSEQTSRALKARNNHVTVYEQPVPAG